MPLLGSKRQKTDKGGQEPPHAAGEDSSEGSTETVKTARKPSLTAKASSPQLRPSPPNVSQHPGLKRGKSRSWYGSFNNKAAAVAQVAKESISVTAGTTSEMSESSGLPKAGTYMHSSLKRARKSIPSAAEATRVHATAENTEQTDGAVSAGLTQVPEEKEADVSVPSGAGNVTTVQSKSSADDTAAVVATDPQNEQAGSWFGWWSRPDGYGAKDDPKSAVHGSADKPVTPNTEPNGNATAPLAIIPPATAQADKPSLSQTPDSSSRTWFGLWSATQNQRNAEQDRPVTSSAASVGSGNAVMGMSSNGSSSNAAQDSSTSQKQPESNRPSIDRPKSSGWAFWSKESPPIQGADSQKVLGELAVADTPSQSHPEAAQFNETSPKKSEPKSKAKPEGKKQSGINKKAAVASTEQAVAEGSVPAADAGVAKKKVQKDRAFATSASAPTDAGVPVPEQPKGQETKPSPALKALKAQHAPSNIIEPRFRSTYPPAHVSTYWETLGYYIAYPFGAAHGPAPSRHVYVVPQKPKIKSAIAIGVHGYFPAPILQKIIGQPTGTSIRFATHAAAAIRAWVEENQPDIPCEVEQVALEGEGFIADRVSTLWKLLLNWLTHLRNADFILVAAHSQGVPVAIMLVAKLIQLGCLSLHVKVGICAMAGVNLGPFADYKSRFFGGSAAELFEFSNPQSKVSLEYASCLDIVLRHGVKVTYCGSMDDQLVSLESSLFANLTHPHVQRAVFIDGRHYTQDFVAALITFALKLRNLGISDHGLVRELSAPLAGSIYGGEGHSRIYDDPLVYAQALEFALETTDMDSKSYATTASASPQLPMAERRRSSDRGIPPTTRLANAIRRGSVSAASQPGIAPEISVYELPASGAAANPFFLPWAMRGILDEPAVKAEMQADVEQLVRLFDEWRPTSKALKDVRFRLEAVKSRL